MQIEKIALTASLRKASPTTPAKWTEKQRISKITDCWYVATLRPTPIEEQSPLLTSQETGCITMLRSVISKFVLMAQWLIIAEIYTGKIQIVQEKLIIAISYNCKGSLPLEILTIKTGRNCSRTLSRTSARCFYRVLQRHNYRREAKAKITLHLSLKAEEAFLTKNILETTKNIKANIQIKISFMLWIQASTNPKIQEERNKIKAITCIHTDLKTSQADNQWEIGVTLMSHLLCLSKTIPMGNQKWSRTQFWVLFQVNRSKIHFKHTFCP